MTVQQLSGILDGFGDSIPFTKEAYGTGEGKEGKGGAVEGGTPSSCLALPLPLCCTAHPQGGAIYTGVLVTVDWK